MDGTIEKLEQILKENETKKKILECLIRSNQANLLVKGTVDKMCTEESQIGRLELRVEALKGLIELVSISKEITDLIDEL